jgi:hypothetical protein
MGGTLIPPRTQVTARGEQIVLRLEPEPLLGQFGRLVGARANLLGGHWKARVTLDCLPSASRQALALPILDGAGSLLFGEYVQRLEEVTRGG